MYIYAYVYIYIFVCMYIDKYIYIYKYTCPVLVRQKLSIPWRRPNRGVARADEEKPSA